MRWLINQNDNVANVIPLYQINKEKPVTSFSWNK